MTALMTMMMPNIRHAFAVAAMLAVTSVPCLAQGTFINLNFEQSLVPDAWPGHGNGESVSVGDGVPGWNVYIGGSQQIFMGHNVTSIEKGSAHSLVHFIASLLWRAEGG
jgi:hypothetical protein